MPTARAAAAAFPAVSTRSHEAAATDRRTLGPAGDGAGAPDATTATEQFRFVRATGPAAGTVVR